MKRFLSLFTTVLLSLAVWAQPTIVVKAGDAQSLLDAIEEANKVNADKNAERLFILIPDGLYDLGKRVLTRVTGHRVSFIGQSMEGTIIQNAPDVKNEGISKTGVLQNRGTGNYYQDLTLRNALDYYAVRDDGRAVTLHDKGNHTICNRVRMLSYQDTYYSDKEECQHYMQDSEIHGTIDFICGAGDVWFERCRIVAENRHPDGSGYDVIMAPRTSDTTWGYVFNNCTIASYESKYYYGRGWHTSPRCVWLHTTLLAPEKLLPERFDPHGMKISSNYFKEYHTMDAKGRDITPQSNVVHFTLRDLTQPFDAETILSKEDARQYTLCNVFGDWKPAKELKKIEKQAKKLMKRL